MGLERPISGPGLNIFWQEHFSEPVSWKTRTLFLPLNPDFLCVLTKKKCAPTTYEVWWRFHAEISDMGPIQTWELKLIRVGYCISGELKSCPVTLPQLSLNRSWYKKCCPVKALQYNALNLTDLDNFSDAEAAIWTFRGGSWQECPVQIISEASGSPMKDSFPWAPQFYLEY